MLREHKQLSTQRGFSLIELIAVIIVLGIVSVVTFARFDNADTAAVQTGRDQVLNAFFVAQQLAMVRSPDDSVQVSVNASSVDVTENGASLSRSGVTYPLTLPQGVSITSGIGTYDYDKLGRTSPAVIALSRGGTSASITLEASGYAHSQ